MPSSPPVHASERHDISGISLRFWSDRLAGQPQLPAHSGHTAHKGAMIPKTFFLAKIFHRIGTSNLRGK
jgi:hypothetical protein